MSGSSEPRPHAACNEKGVEKAARLAQKTHIKHYSGAIAFFDLPGSTEMMKGGPLKAIRAMLRHNAVCRAVVEANGGRIIKELGDGVMVMFDNVGTAVECAAKVVQCVKEHGGGTHTKAVVASGSLWSEVNASGICDVYGTPVHVCARMAEQAIKDGILIDGKDKKLVAEWLERTGFRIHRTQKRLRSYPDRRAYAVSAM